MEILSWADKTEQAVEGCPEDDRSHHINECYFDDCGGKNYVFPDGTFSVFKSLFLPKIRDKIKLNSEVKGIDYSGTTVKVSTSSGAYNAQHVIFTPSTGFLKANYKNLFHPHLPADKATAIESLPFGQAEKCIFYYEKPFWPANAEGSGGPFEGYDFIPSEQDDTLKLKMTALLGREVLHWFFCCCLLLTFDNLPLEALYKFHLKIMNCIYIQCLLLVSN